MNSHHEAFNGAESCIVCYPNTGSLQLYNFPGTGLEESKFKQFEENEENAFK